MSEYDEKCLSEAEAEARSRKEEEEAREEAEAYLLGVLAHHRKDTCKNCPLAGQNYAVCSCVIDRAVELEVREREAAERLAGLLLAQTAILKALDDDPAGNPYFAYGDYFRRVGGDEEYDILFNAAVQLMQEAVDDLEDMAKAAQSCIGCAAHCGEDEPPEGAPDCGSCKNNSNWRWRGMPCG